VIRLVASDIDGTIIGEENTLTTQNLKAIHDMKASNINFAICTGKPYAMVKNFCKDLQARFWYFWKWQSNCRFTKRKRNLSKNTNTENKLIFVSSLLKKKAYISIFIWKTK